MDLLIWHIEYRLRDQAIELLGYGYRWQSHWSWQVTPGKMCILSSNLNRVCTVLPHCDEKSSVQIFTKCADSCKGLLLDPQPDSDLEEPLRKRQRTQSPHDQPAIVSKWEQICNGDIGEGNVLKDPQERRDGAEVNLEQKNQQPSDNVIIQIKSAFETPTPHDPALHTIKGVKTNSPARMTPPKKMLMIRPNGRLASPKARVEKSETQITEITQDSDPLQKRASKVPNRNFKITANGTLDSLSTEAPSNLPRRRGRKKKSETEPIMRPICVVVLKYQRVDGIEASIGRHIDEIL